MNFLKERKIKNIKDIRNINYLINILKFNDLKNGTYQLDNNFKLTRMNKQDMLRRGKFIFGIKKEFPSREFIKYWKNKVGIHPLFLGKWKDPRSNKWIIEIVEFENNRNKAIQKAIEAKQFSIWDAEKEEEIILKWIK